MADLGAGVDDLEGPPTQVQLVAHGQAGLPASDHEHIQRWPVRGRDAHRSGSGVRFTVKLNNMPLSACPAMWQCAIHAAPDC